jgi:hypothetical protein
MTAEGGGGGSSDQRGLVAKYTCDVHGRCCARDHVMYNSEIDPSTVSKWQEPIQYQKLVDCINDWRGKITSHDHPSCRCVQLHAHDVYADKNAHPLVLYMKKMSSLVSRPDDLFGNLHWCSNV